MVFSTNHSDASKLRGARIVFVFHGGEQGGAEHQGLILANHLKELIGAEIIVLGLMAQSPGKVARRCKKSAIQWQAVPFSWPVDWGGKILSLYRLARVIKELKPDILLPYTYFPNVVCSLIWRFTGASLCVWNQRDEGRCLDINFWHKAAIWLVPCLVSNSIIGKEFLERQYSLQNKTVSVIPNALALIKPRLNRYEWRVSLGLSQTRFVAIMVANVHGFKDHKTLLKAWRAFLDKLSEHTERPMLLLAGRFDGAESELFDLTSELDIITEVLFLGEIDDVPGLLSASDLYIHSSQFEGLPNAILEAMSMSLPVVATDIPGIREAVGTYGANFLSRGGDYNQMADLIVSFYNDASLRSQTGKILNKYVMEKHKTELMIYSSINIMSRYIKK